MELILPIAKHIRPHCPGDVIGEPLRGDDAGIVFFEINGVAAEVDCVEVRVGEGHSGGVWVGGVPES